MPEPWVSVQDVARHLGVRKDSVYRWIDQRDLPAKKIGKLWKLKLSEVDAWVRAGGADGNAPAKTPPPVFERTGARPLVLVVDDDDMVRETVVEFLGDEGFTVLAAADGGEAMSLLGGAAIQPSAILLDLKMPNVDGWQFRELQTRDPALAPIPVIVVTAADDRALAGTTTLRKPLRLPDLARALTDVLRVKTLPPPG